MPVVSSQPASQPSVFELYAGSASCADCHEEAYEEWKTSHHANAQRDVSAELDRDPFVPTRSIKHASQTSSAELRDETFTLVTMGPDGSSQAFHPTGAIGVAPLWQYLIPQTGGRVQVTELAFDPARKEWFDVYGDEDRQHWEWGHWSQRGMNWNSMCATCHNSVYRKSFDLATDGYDSKYLEQGVGCEQCHGPLQAHVEWQEANPDTEGDPTIPPLDGEDHFSVCATCHARRGELTDRFAPGDAFLEHYEPMVPDLSDTFYPDGQVWDEDFEYAAFTQSYMYAWGVRCTDCHYWHSGKVASTENNLCLRCHEGGIATKRPIDPVEHSFHPEGKEGFKCVDCHMPQTVYMARHWRRDHGMTIPDPLLTREYGVPNACTRCHVEEGLDWSIEYVDKWYGQLMDRATRTRARLLARLKAGDLTAGPDVLALIGQEKNAHWRAIEIRFCQAMIERATSEEQIAPLVGELLARLEDESPLVQSAAIDALEPLGPMMAAPLMPKLDSPHRLVRVKAAWALRRVLDLKTLAGQDLLAYLECRQDQPLGAYQWATFQADRNNPTEALAWYERSLRWDSRLVPARHAYATLLHQMGRSDDGADVLLEGSEIEPTNALYPYWLGLLYSEMGDLKAARGALKAAVARDGSQARYWYNLAMAENGLNQTDEAFDALAKAEELAPDNPEYPYTRAYLHLQLNQIDQAREDLERALNINPEHAPSLELMNRLRSMGT